MKIPLLLFFVCSSFTCIAQDWKEIPLSNLSAYQSNGLDVHLFKEEYVGASGQQFTVKLSNLTVQKIAVKGTLNALTYCGNTISVTIDVVINPGKTLGGNAYAFDVDGLAGTVLAENCRTEKIYPNPADKTSYRYDRIKALGLSKLSITKVEEEKVVAAATGSNAATPATQPSPAITTQPSPYSTPLKGIHANNNGGQPLQQQSNINTTTQTVNNALEVVKSNSDVIGGWLIGSKTAYQKRQEKIQELQAKIKAHQDKIAEEKARDSLFELQVADSVQRIAQVLVEDIQLMDKTNDQKATMELLTRICARLMRINYLRTRTRSELESKYNATIGYNINTESYEGQHVDLYHLPDNYRSGFYDPGVKTANLYTVANMHSVPFIQTYLAHPAEPENFSRERPQLEREMLWNYMSAYANLEYAGNNKSERKKFKKDYAVALLSLQKMQDAIVFDSSGHNSIDTYKAFAYELNGEILYDSAAMTNKAGYLEQAYNKMMLALEHSIVVEHWIQQHYVGKREELLPAMRGGMNNSGTQFVVSFVNLLIVTDQLLAPGVVPAEQQQRYLTGCLNMMNTFLRTQ